jgi:hypothetical protein
MFRATLGPIAQFFIDLLEAGIERFSLCTIGSNPAADSNLLASWSRFELSRFRVSSAQQSSLGLVLISPLAPIAAAQAETTTSGCQAG